MSYVRCLSAGEQTCMNFAGSFTVDLQHRAQLRKGGHTVTKRTAVPALPEAMQMALAFLKGLQA